MQGLNAVEIMCGLQIVLGLPPAPPPASVMRFAQLIGGAAAAVPLDLMDSLLRPGGWSHRAEVGPSPNLSPNPSPTPSPTPTLTLTLTLTRRRATRPGESSSAIGSRSPLPSSPG